METKYKAVIDDYICLLTFGQQPHIQSIVNCLFHNFPEDHNLKDYQQTSKAIKKYLQTHPFIIWIQKDISQPWIRPGFYKK